MALFECRFFSETLQLASSMTVILPQRLAGRPELEALPETGPWKTLYLLHGLSDDHTGWQRRSAVERYVAPLGVAVVMPAVDRSFYTDMHRGKAYERYVAEELPAIARSFFPLSAAREDTYVAGLSMGGYGAFKLALNYPERYCAAASLSGVLDLAPHVRQPQDWVRNDFANVFGEGVTIDGTRHDLPALLGPLAASGRPVPRLYLCCGEADALYPDNLRFLEAARRAGVETTWRSDPGYDHTWDYWDLRLADVLRWMFGKCGK